MSISAHKNLAPGTLPFLSFILGTAPLFFWAENDFQGDGETFKSLVAKIIPKPFLVSTGVSFDTGLFGGAFYGFPSRKLKS